MSAQDSRTLRQRLTDAVLGFIEDQMPVRTVTARTQAHNAFLMGVDVGEAGMGGRVRRERVGAKR